ncbi:MAG: EamA family transporter [Acidobacteria bacterium]|nr:EamA family transporter [Acidobacteriota bacterium]
MKSFYLPIAMIIFGGLVYQVSQKAIPKTAFPLHAIIIAYLAGIVLCAIFALFYSTESSFLNSFKESNWAVFGVGIGAAFIEIGFLLAYRVGWNISNTSIIISIAVAVLLIPIGIFFFKEKLSFSQGIGLALCIIGLILVVRK